MKITVRFFANLKDMAGTESMELAFDGEVRVKELTARLLAELPSLKDVLETRRVFVCVNQEMVQKDDIIKDGDEVALLPPFSGGK